MTSDMNILIVDNYDSFTYNIVQLVRNINGKEPDVKRNDRLSISDVTAYDGIILSPGPGIPDEAGLLLEIIKTYGASRRMLGICLGHQAIGEAYGAQLINMPRVLHGVASDIRICADDTLCRNLPETIQAGRYHSWVISRDNFPDRDLEILMEDADGNIMAIRHRKYDLKGVQFHPESILTPMGYHIMYNWIKEAL